MDILSFLIKFSIPFLFLIICASLFVLFARKFKIITVICLYLFLAMLAVIAIKYNIGAKIDFYDGVGDTITVTLSTFASLFSAIYLALTQLIMSIAPKYSQQIYDFMVSEAFLISYHSVLFVISLFFFRKKKKTNIEQSRYND